MSIFPVECGQGDRLMQITTTQQYNTLWAAGNSNAGNPTAGYGSGSSAGYGSGSSSGSGSVSSATTTATTTSTIPTTTIIYKENFDLKEIELGLPVAFNMNFMTIEAEASYVFPAYSDPYFPGPKGFIFSLGCFFKIF